MPYLGASPRNINTRSVIDHQEYLGSQADTSTNSGYYTFYVNYTPGNVSVVIRGVHMASSDYTATNGTDVRISTSTITLANDDVIEIIGYGIPSSQILERSDVNITGGQAINLTQVGASSYKVGNTEVIDSSRVVDAASVKVAGTEVIDSNKSLNVFDVKVGGNTVIDSNRKMTGVDIVPTTNFTFRNKIINGDMRISQRSTNVSSFTADAVTGGFKTLDRFYHELGSAGTYTLSQNSITDLAGFKKSLKVFCTASATPSGTAQFNVHQRIESNHFYDLAFGTSSAKPINYSFWVKTNVAGDYIIWFLNIPDQRMTSKKYTISSGETGSWKHISVTVNGDTGGSVFDADNSHAFQVRHVLASGGDYTSGTYMDGTWQTVSGNTGNVYAGQTANVSSAINNYYEITGVQLEEGTVATPFEHRPIGTELALCQRYFTKSHNSELVAGTDPTGGGAINVFVPSNGTGYFGVYVPFPVEMRNDPTITLYDSANASGKVFKGGDGKSQYIFRKGRRGFSGGTQDATNTNELFFTYTALDEL